MRLNTFTPDGNAISLFHLDISCAVSVAQRFGYGWCLYDSQMRRYFNRDKMTLELSAAGCWFYASLIETTIRAFDRYKAGILYPVQSTVTPPTTVIQGL